jgi:hypothetical protein
LFPAGSAESETIFGLWNQVCLKGAGVNFAPVSFQLSTLKLSSFPTGAEVGSATVGVFCFPQIPQNQKQFLAFGIKYV